MDPGQPVIVSQNTKEGSALIPLFYFRALCISLIYVSGYTISVIALLDLGFIFDQCEAISSKPAAVSHLNRMSPEELNLLLHSGGHMVACTCFQHIFRLYGFIHLIAATNTHREISRKPILSFINMAPNVG